LSDLDQLGVAVLRYLAEHLEGLHIVHLVALHHDSFGLADAVPGGQRGFKLLTFLAGKDRRGRVRRENGTDGLGFSTPDVRLESEQVQRARGAVRGVELE